MRKKDQWVIHNIYTGESRSFDIRTKGSFRHSRFHFGGLIKSGLTVLISVLIIFTVVKAGSITPPEGERSAQFYTLTDIYNRLYNNSEATLGGHSFEFLDNLDSTHYTLKQIYNLVPTINPSKLLDDTTYLGITGNIATRTLSNTTTTVSAGYYSATTLDTVDDDLATGNIKSGVTLFGIDGNGNVVDTSSGTVTNNNQIRSSYISFSNGTQYTGSLADCSSNGEQSCYTTGSYYAGTQQSLDNTTTTVSAGYYGAGDALSTVDGDLAEGNIASGVVIFGLTGTLPAGGLPDENQIACYNNSAACTCGEADCTGDTAWPNQTAQNGEDGSREDDLTIGGCGSGTVSDSLTGLCWQRDASTSGQTWKNALQYCNNLDLGGHTDWRLPKASELVSIVDYGYENSSYWHTTKFTNYAADYYWSATTRPSSVSLAYYLFFSNGNLSGSNKPGTYYAVCVRDN